MQGDCHNHHPPHPTNISYTIQYGHQYINMIPTLNRSYVLPQSISQYLSRENYTFLLKSNAVIYGLMALCCLIAPHKTLPNFLLLHTSTLNKNSKGETVPIDIYSPQLHELARLFAASVLTLSFILYQTSKSYDGPFRKNIAKASKLFQSL